MTSRLAAWSAGRFRYLTPLGAVAATGGLAAIKALATIRALAAIGALAAIETLAATGALAAGVRTRAVGAFLRAGGTGKGVLVVAGRRGKSS